MNAFHHKWLLTGIDPLVNPLVNALFVQLTATIPVPPLPSNIISPGHQKAKVKEKYKMRLNACRVAMVVCKVLANATF